MTGKQLKNSILQWAIQGKLVPQDPTDEPASVLLEKIRQEKERLIKEKKIKRDKNASIIYRGEDNSYYEKFIATREVKCIDEEIPFEIPKGWEWCRLNDLALYRKGPFGSSLTKSMFVPQSSQSIKVYEQKNAIQKDFSLGEYYISKEKFETMQSFIVTPNDIIVSCAGTIGETYLLPSNAPIGIINQALMRVSLFELSMASYWQMYFSYILLNEAQMKGAGSAIKNIPPFEYLKAVLVPVPPLSEQNRLVERYNLLLSLIAKYESEADKLNCLNLNIYDKLKKSVLQEAIQGKLVPQIAEEGTARELLEQIKIEKQELVKEGKLKKSALNDSVIFKGDDNKYWEKSDECIECIDDKIPFEIPLTWRWVRHNQLFEISGGSQPPKSQFVDNPKPGYIRLYQIRDYGSNPMPIYIPMEKANKMTKEGDIILARYGASLGKVFWAKDGAYNVAMAKVIPLFESELVNKQYLFLFYQSSIYQYLVKDHSRSAQAGFNKDDLTDLFFPLPPLQEQYRIVEKYKSVASIMSK